MITSTWWPFADLALKTTLIFLIAAGAAAVLRRASASTRHLVWSLAFASALALPLLASFLPTLPVPLVEPPRLGSAAPAPPPGAQAAVAVPEAPAVSTAGDPAPPPAPARPDATQSVTAPVASVPLSRLLDTVDWTQVLLLVWIAGALLVLARLALGLIAVQWMARRTAPITDAAWLPVADGLARSLGISAPVTYLRSPRATMPMAWGVTRPTVLMPADADAWPLERLRIVLLHELAHVQRRDCLTHVVAQVTCALHWYNPLAWMASRRARAEREHACDDIVLAAGTEGPSYAEELIEMARAMRDGRFPAVVLGATLAMAHRSQLEGRLMAILDPRISRGAMTRVRVAAGSVLMASALVPLAAIQPWDAEAPADRPVVQAMDVRDHGALISPKLPPAPRPHEVVTHERDETAAARGGSAPGPTEPQQESPRTTASAAAAAVATGPWHAPITAALADVLDRFSIDLEVAGEVAVQTAPTPAATPDPKPATAAAAKPVVAESGRRRQADPRAVAALTAALQDSDRQVRETAMNALVQLRVPEAYDPLVKALADESAEIRERAVFGLGQLRDKRAVDPLAGALKDGSADVREQAAFALGQIRDPRGVDPLMGALTDGSADVREQAAFGLGQLRDARAVDPLAAALKDASLDVREQAAFALGQIRDKRAAQALGAAITDESPDVREKAVFALGQLRDASAIDGLTIALRDAKPDVREQAAFALGQIRDARAVAPLTSALKDSSEDVREQAAFALGQIRDAAAVEALVIALKDGSEDVREQAAFALGQLRDARAIEALTALLKDSSKDVRQQAAFALGQIAR